RPMETRPPPPPPPAPLPAPPLAEIVPLPTKFLVESTIDPPPPPPPLTDGLAAPSAEILPSTRKVPAVVVSRRAPPPFPPFPICCALKIPAPPRPPDCMGDVRESERTFPPRAPRALLPPTPAPLPPPPVELRVCPAPLLRFAERPSELIEPPASTVILLEAVIPT